PRPPAGPPVPAPRVTPRSRSRCPTSSSGAWTRPSRSDATIPAGAGRARSTRSATAPRRAWTLGALGDRRDFAYCFWWRMLRPDDVRDPFFARQPPGTMLMTIHETRPGTENLEMTTPPPRVARSHGVRL